MHDARQILRHVAWYAVFCSPIALLWRSRAASRGTAAVHVVVAGHAVMCLQIRPSWVLMPSLLLMHTLDLCQLRPASWLCRPLLAVAGVTWALALRFRN